MQTADRQFINHKIKSIKYVLHFHFLVIICFNLTLQMIWKKKKIIILSKLTF